MLRSTAPYNVLEKLFNSLIINVSSNERINTIDGIINSGIDINVHETSEFGNTIFTTLLSNEDSDIFVQLLTRYRSKIKFAECDNQGKTILSLSIRMIKPQLAELILKHDKTSINMADNEGRTPLHYACILGIISVANILIINGGYLTVKDKKGLTPADYLNCADTEVYECLRAVSIDPRRHPLAPRDRLIINNICYVFTQQDLDKNGWIAGLPWYSELHHHRPQTQGRVGILLCNENFSAIFSFLNIDINAPDFRPANNNIRLLVTMKNNPDTLLDFCMRNRTQFAAYVYFKTAEAYFKKNNLNDTYFYLSKAEKFYQSNNNNKFCNEEQFKILRKKAGAKLQTREIVISSYVLLNHFKSAATVTPENQAAQNTGLPSRPMP
jgi:ankyrin repeat protein